MKENIIHVFKFKSGRKLTVRFTINVRIKTFQYKK